MNRSLNHRGHREHRGITGRLVIVQTLRPFLILLTAVLIWSNFGVSQAMVMRLNSVREASYYSCETNRKLDGPVIAALEADGCRFRSGLWVNGRVDVTFAGNIKALNTQLRELNECPSKCVSVCFEPLSPNTRLVIDCADICWTVSHDPRNGIFKFIIDTNSSLFYRDDILSPTQDRPEIEP